MVNTLGSTGMAASRKCTGVGTLATRGFQLTLTASVRIQVDARR